MSIVEQKRKLNKKLCSKGLYRDLFFILFISSLISHPSSLIHAALQAAGAYAVDTAGVARTNFNSTEAVGFLQKVNNTSAGANLIQFSFRVTDPTGRVVLSHSGNAAPSSIMGEAASQVAGMLISAFYTSPGNYTLTAAAVLDGQTLTQTTVFNISSPLITLLYPPNGIRSMSASPLTFSWTGSGASRYRVIVDDDTSFYNALFTGLTNGPETTMTYPDNPSNPLARLSSGQVYYWKVEGLDVAGGKISESTPPFDFSLNQPTSKSSSRDIALTNLQWLSDMETGQIGALSFAVSAVNQGGQAESNISIALYVNGVASQDSPKIINSLAVNESKSANFTATVSPDARLIIVQANTSFFDDNVQNNRATMTLSMETVKKVKRSRFKIKGWLPPEIWEIILRGTSPMDPIVLNLQGYGAVEVQGDGMTPDEINELISALTDGKARISRLWLD